MVSADSVEFALAATLLTNSIHTSRSQSIRAGRNAILHGARTRPRQRLQLEQRRVGPGQYRQTGADSCTMCIWLYGRVLQGCVLAETMLLEVPFPAKVSGSVVGQGEF